MRDPKQIDVIIPKATYDLPEYKVTKDGFVDAGYQTIFFCKGNKEDDSAFRQQGVFTESLLQVCVNYLEDNNVGELMNTDTSLAIISIKDAMASLQKRADERKARGVQGSYKK